ncbi:hypothetical protein AX16_010370 [Volvariella volvacea WC 439]|nr:hypothetical protein AX16_010370 [Volvariella volvacea WC 439]
MQTPSEEIRHVVGLFTMAVSPDIQQAALERYLTPDVEFRHPICAVTKGPMSRETVIGIYQWYRIISPHIELQVKHVAPDGELILLLEIVQTFHLRRSPFRPVPSRLLTRVQLRKEEGLYYIEKQEDFYHPDDFAALVFPPLIGLIRILLLLAGFATCLLAKLAQVLGYWMPDSTKKSWDGATSASADANTGEEHK